MSQKGFRVATHESCTPAGEGNYQHFMILGKASRLTASIKLAIIKMRRITLVVRRFCYPNTVDRKNLMRKKIDKKEIAKEICKDAKLYKTSFLQEVRICV